MAIATGFDFQPLDDGNLLIEFIVDDGKAFNTQVVTPDVMNNMAMVSVLTNVALKKGPQVAQEIMGKLAADRDKQKRRERNFNMEHRTAPNWDDFGRQRMFIPFFVYGRDDVDVGPFEGFCRGHGAISGNEKSYENTVGIYTAEGVYYNILIDTRVNCVIP